MEKSKKSLGQNFLLNAGKIKEIIGALDMESGDTVVEIGPGHGELTDEVIKKLSNSATNGSEIITIEKDETLNCDLKERFKNIKNIQTIGGDALKLLPQIISQLPNYPIANYKLVGNIPYYITGFLLRTISELKNKPIVAVLTVQKEVAKRICGEMSLLAASVRYWAEPEIVGIIPKSDFSPEPKVDSAIIRLKTRENNREMRDGDKKAENYYKFIKILFKQPRKTALNNLMGTKINKNELEKMLGEAGIKPNARPQDLRMAQLEILAEKTASNVVY